MSSAGPWRAYLFLALTGFLSTFAFSVIHPVLPLYVQSLGVSYEQVGFLFSIYSLTWSVLQIYTGYLADRLGRKRMALLGLGVYAAFALGNYAAQNFGQLFLFRTLQGVGVGLIGPAILGLTAGFAEKGKSFAFYRAANGAGSILGPIAGGFLGDYSLRYPFLLSALAALLTCTAVLGMKEDRSVRSEARFFRAISGLLRNRFFLLTCIGAFLAELGFASFEIGIPLKGTRLALTPAQIGIVLSAYFVTFTLLQVPVGVCAEKVGKSRILWIASALSVFLFLGLYLAGGFLPLVLLMAVLGVTLGAVFVQATAAAAEVVPEGAQAMSLAFFDSLVDLSFIVMPLVVGFSAGWGESIPFLVCTFVLAGASILFLLGRPRKQKQNQCGTSAQYPLHDHTQDKKAD